MDTIEKQQLRRQGIERAKLAKRYKGRRPALTPRDIKTVQRRVRNGESMYQIAASLGVSRRTLYNYVGAYVGTPKWQASVAAQRRDSVAGRKVQKRRVTKKLTTREKDRPFTEERQKAWREQQAAIAERRAEAMARFQMQKRNRY